MNKYPSAEERKARVELAIRFLPAAAALRPTKPEKLSPAMRIALLAFELAKGLQYWSERHDQPADNKPEAERAKEAGGEPESRESYL